jgi:4-hydroxymandelate synthase
LYGIAYLELYAHDREAVAGYFTESFGFAVAATSEEPGRSVTLLRQGTVQLAVSSGPDTAEFVEEHGDGVADIAFTCDEIPSAMERAVAAGARRLGPATVSGFGGVRHTLVPGVPAPGHGLPAGRSWIPAPRRAHPEPEPPIRKLDHIAVCVPAGTLHDTVRHYERGFGFEQYSSEYVEVGAQAMDSVVVRSASGNVTFTILEPDSSHEPGQIDSFLQRNGGAGVQHLAFLVDDIVPTVRAFRARGAEFLTTPAAYYAMLADRMGDFGERIADLRDTDVLADRDEWGYLLQLFSRSPHERNTIFYELIQRRGAQGFGSANIRALYESVERERATAV